jgi:acetoacetate decarboxylase
MKADEFRRRAFAMPPHSPSFPPGPYRFVGREYMTIAYPSDVAVIKRIVPEPLEPIESVVRLEFVRMPDSTGFGAYHGVAQKIAVRFRGEVGSYVRLMFLDTHPPIAGGRELWGFPQKLALPHLAVERDTLVGKLDFGPVRVATGTMGYKHSTVDIAELAKRAAEPVFLLKIIPHVDGSARICELVRVGQSDIRVHGAWTAPASVALHPHALAPIADLPVMGPASGLHHSVDCTLDLGTVVHDYLAAKKN